MAKEAAGLPPPSFDVESWSQHYEGPLLPLRLAHIAIRCPQLARPTMVLAISHAQQGKDVQVYQRLVRLAHTLGFPDVADVDAEWAALREEANRRELARLESELRGYKNNLIRESIRMGQEDLAALHLATGGPPLDPASSSPAHNSGYNAAYQAFGKMRDYCTTPAHVNSMTVRLAFTALVHAVSCQQLHTPASAHWNGVLINAQRLRSSGVKAEEQVKLTPVSCVAAGIAQIGLGAYADATRSFLQTAFDYHHSSAVHGLSFESLMASANDVAIYGGLTALATLSREELVDDVLGGSFRIFLEQEPHMRKAISLYTTAKYQACLALLARYRTDWSLDIYLGAAASSRGSTHVDTLLARIRERSITAYFASFSEASLKSLAATFPPPPSTVPTAALEAEVLAMIDAGSLDARLDLVGQSLVAPQQDARAATHCHARGAAEEVERTLLLRLHRVNMVLAGLEVPRPAAGGWGGSGIGLGTDI